DNIRDQIFAFQLPAPTPAPTAAAVSGLDVESATISGSVGGGVGAGLIAYHFEWGQTSSYGSSGGDGAAAPGTTVSMNLSGLVPGATYHWRLVVTTAAGTAATADQTFTTPGPVTG